MKKMLINATQEEELRVALVDGKKLYDLDISQANLEQKKANIYKGIITRIEPSLEAAFVNYGANRHGFLPQKEIAPHFYPKNHDLDEKLPIQDLLKEGQEIIIQVEKEERGNKGAAITTFISLAGNYLVLMPNNPNSGGISRRIDGKSRFELKKSMEQLKVPDSMGVIIRTAGVGRTTLALQTDFDTLKKYWNAILKAAKENKAPVLIHQEGDIISRALRDYLRDDISEIIVDSQNVLQRIKQHVQHVNPKFLSKIKEHKRKFPIFSHYQIERQIEETIAREVKLPSGGSLVIDTTEALTAIDINSAKATKGTDIEDTALSTNLEAASEIARQLRLRDLGGLVVIDFIDMLEEEHQLQVEERIIKAFEFDRARIQFGKISKFGLLEMSRQRLRPSLSEFTHHACPKCKGLGFIRDIESLALSVLRLIEEEAIKEKTRQVYVQVPVEIGAYLLNEKRKVIYAIEKRYELPILIISNHNIKTPNFFVESKKENNQIKSASYTHLKDTIFKDNENYNKLEIDSIQKPLVSSSSFLEKSSSGLKFLDTIKTAISKIFYKKDIPENNSVEPEKTPNKRKNSNYRKNKKSPTAKKVSSLDAKLEKIKKEKALKEKAKQNNKKLHNIDKKEVAKLLDPKTSKDKAGKKQAVKKTATTKNLANTKNIKAQTQQKQEKEKVITEQEILTKRKLQKAKLAKIKAINLLIKKDVKLKQQKFIACVEPTKFESISAKQKAKTRKIINENVAIDFTKEYGQKIQEESSLFYSIFEIAKNSSNSNITSPRL